MSVCFECCVLWGRGLCNALITRPEESYRLWCVVVCDLETSRMGRPWPALGCSVAGKRKNGSFSGVLVTSQENNLMCYDFFLWLYPKHSVWVSWVDSQIKGAQAAISLALEKGNCRLAYLCMKGNVVYLTIPHLRLYSVEFCKSSELWLVHNSEPLADVYLTLILLMWRIGWAHNNARK